ncbi:unnamed protein product, partial [Didymodactylos carnosus]
ELSSPKRKIINKLDKAAEYGKKRETRKNAESISKTDDTFRHSEKHNVVDILKNNLLQVLERDEKLDNLVARSNALMFEAQTFCRRIAYEPKSDYLQTSTSVTSAQSDDELNEKIQSYTKKKKKSKFSPRSVEKQDAYHTEIRDLLLIDVTPLSIGIEII